MLYSLGGVSFEVQPTNLHETSRETGHDWVAKDIIGAQRPREGMGMADSPITLKGKLFPHKFGPGDLASLVDMSRDPTAQMLIRGDGVVFGWYCITKVKQTHTYLDGQGVGKIIEFEIEMFHSPTGPSADSMMSMLLSLF